MPTYIEDLKTMGFVSFAYPRDLRKSVEKTVESWKKFCALGAQEKTSLPYSNRADGVGYELKDGTGPHGDHKENFDVALAGKKWLEENASKIQSPVALEFVQTATALVESMKPLIFDFARQTEAAFGLQGFVREVEQSEENFFVRFIHYFSGQKEGKETASAHADQSGFTLHLFESADGLQCLSYDGTWIDMPVSAGETVIIPAMQLQLRSKGELRALAHRVIATKETADEGRFSAVSFVQLKNTPKYDKEKHGRLQEKKPGFNYDMSYTEFQKLFK